jgi:hypothetical protein
MGANRLLLFLEVFAFLPNAVEDYINFGLDGCFRRVVIVKHNVRGLRGKNGADGQSI